jgi:hypothetical protein
MTTGSAVTLTQQELAAQLAHDYIRSTKRWPEKDYHLEVLRQEGGPHSSVIVLDVVHQDDLNPRRRGSNKSVQLHIDLTGHKVVKELAYQ